MPPVTRYVLVVDDEPANLTMFSLLCREWYTSLTVRDVEKAALLRRSHTFDLAIIDHRLTGEATGLALFEEMTCPKVLLSKKPEMAAWAEARGGRLLRKPIDFLAAKKLLREIATKR